MRIVIAGAGGHGREIHAWLTLSPRFRAEHAIEEIVFVNDVVAPLIDAPLLGTIRDFRPEPNDRVIVALGEPDDRLAVVEHLSSRGARFLTFVHDDALVASTAVLGTGAVICPRVVVSADVRLGQHVHLNVGAVVSHDAIIGDFVTLGPGSYALGGASVGRASYVGAGAIVLPRRRIGERTTVGAQAAVIGDHAEGGTIVGVPARTPHRPAR